MAERRPWLEREAAERRPWLEREAAELQDEMRRNMLEEFGSKALQGMHSLSQHTLVYKRAALEKNAHTRRTRTCSVV